MSEYPGGAAPAAVPARRYDDPAWAPWGFIDMLAVMILTLLALLAISLVFILSMKAAGINADPTKSAGGAAGGLIAQFFIDLAAVVIAALFSLRKYRCGLQAWAMRPVGSAVRVRWVVAVLAASFGTLLLYQAVVSALGLQKLEARENVPAGLLDHAAVVPLTIVLVVIVAPLAEEMFFRGFFFNGLRRRFGTYGAAAASGMLFSAIHVQGLDYVGLVVPFAVIGFLLAVLVARTGSLWNAILVHFGFNAFGMGGSVGGWPGALAAIILIAGVYAAAAYLRPWAGTTA